MNPSDIEMYRAWMRGDSIGSIAKRYKLHKTQVRKVVTRVVEQRSPEALLELPGDQAGERRDV
jgi:Mor family transcriptional regulator